MKRTEISMPKSSPAILVNLKMMVAALKIARRTSRSAVQTQTLWKQLGKERINNSTYAYSMTLKNLSFFFNSLPTSPS
jgi:hypothetical protein